MYLRILISNLEWDLKVLKNLSVNFFYMLVSKGFLSGS